MDNKDIKVKCKRCGRSANADEFVLDPDFKMMVCPFCIKDKRMKHEVYVELEKEKEKKNVVDKEDEHLERAYKAKLKQTVKVERIDDEKVKYKCPKCGYSFIYNPARNIPARCSYCGSDVSKIRYH